MPNSNRGFGRGNGTVTVIEQPVMRSYRRKAKIVFYVTLVIVAALTATVAASKWQPLLALFAGLVLGTVVAAIAAGIVTAWPVIRAIWWWTPETVLTGSLIFGWVELADHTNLYWRLAVVFVIIGILAAVKPVRDRINQATWCLVTRHRIRTCFSEFIITNRTGSLPLILWARPTPWENACGSGCAPACPWMTCRTGSTRSPSPAGPAPPWPTPPPGPTPRSSGSTSSAATC